VLILQT